MTSTALFKQARDTLIEHRTDYDRAVAAFSWPRLQEFNWALDWFDVIAKGNSRTALRIVGDAGRDTSLSFEELRQRSNRLANHLRALGLRRGDRILLMLGNVPNLWELMLAAIKLSCPIIPTTTLMMPDDLRDRVVRGGAKAIVTEAAYADRFGWLGDSHVKLLAAGQVSGWKSLADAAAAAAEFVPDGPTNAAESLLLYFTSGTTAKPKLVQHTHESYPVGHLSTMYWLGLRPGDVHLNLSSPGWAKHAWSCFFAPWNAEATVVAMQTARFDPAQLLRELERCEVTSFCAPPTVWRALIQLPLEDAKVKLRELLSAGEPLNPEVIAQVQAAWGLTIRDGYGQTETTLQVGNFPGQPVKAGSMGRAAPGYRIALLDDDGHEREEGEISVALAGKPVGVMPGYLGDPARTANVMRHGHYHTGDVATRDADGYYTYVGRNDDVFKCSDYRISPFELESLLIEHECVMEAAVVPSPDPQRLAVPKAFVVLRQGFAPTRETALSILRFVRGRSSPFKRVRRLEFADLPKTVSGKIRRVELRGIELQRTLETRRPQEFWEEDFAELKRQYRNARPSDIAECIELRGQTRENAVSVERLRQYGVTRESWSASVADGSLPGHVCTEDGRIVGYCFGDARTGEIVVLALLPQWEGRGIGKALLEMMVADLARRGFRRLFLGCSSDPKVRSYGFYRHLGWRSTGTFDGHGDEVLEYFP